MQKIDKYPVLTEPPYAHAITKWYEDKRLLVYEYNGRPVISITIPGIAHVDYRLSSDGDIISDPFVQQHYVVVSEPVEGMLTFQLSSDAINMRPKRAGNEHAILGQVGRPLMFGVNGMYDINQDMLIDWYGSEWKWLGSKLVENESGDLIASMRVILGPSPWIINMKMQYYRRHLGYTYHKPWEWKPKIEPISGWCSWEAYRREVSEEKIEKVTEFISDHFKEYGMKYIQLDDGFQPPQIPSSIDRSVADDWLSMNERFPSGHGGNVENIKRHGLEAGIWIYTYVHNKEYAQKNPGFIKDEKGEPVEGDWLGFVVDCLPETLDRYITPSFEGFKMLGYTYIKTDGLRHLLYDGLHEAVRRGILTNNEAEIRFRRYVEYIRKALGENVFYLSSWGVMSQMVGIADACRIATDVNPSWAHMRMQMMETARWFHTQRILYINDPDHLCLRSKYEWAKSAISLCSLSGGLFMLSDTPEEYDEQRVSMIRKNLPPLNTYTAETGILDTDIQAYTWTKAHGAAFVASRDAEIKMNVSEDSLITAAGRYATVDKNHPFSTLWAFHIDTEVRKWCVLGRFATSPLKECEVSFESLHIEPKNDYVAFDFWEQKHLGTFNGKIPCRKLALGCCQIIALCAVTEHPQFMGSSRHVSMDAVSLKSQNWAEENLKLELTGIIGTCEFYWIHAPKGYIPKVCTLNGEKTQFIQQGEAVKVDVCFKTAEVILSIAFNKEVCHGKLDS